MYTNKIPAGSGEYYLDNSTEKWVLDAGQTRTSKTNGIAIDANWHDNVLVINGTIDASDDQYHSGIDNDAINTKITVGKTGDISALYGISSGGDNASIINNGEISGVRSGLYVFGDNSRIVNNGTIDGHNDPKYNTAAVDINSDERAWLTNGGSINGGIDANAHQLVLKFTAASSISGGVDIQSDAGDTSVITNRGMMIDDNTSGWAFNGWNGNEKLVNRGTIDGAVGLGAGNDTFDGRGGKVTDYITGDIGNDTYIVDTRKVELAEYADQGTDTVKSAVTFSLDVKYDYELENLVLLGTKDINGSGNALGNEITGNAGNNRLFGAAGTDILTGGKGADTFVFKTGSDIDTVTDFGRGGDRIDLSHIQAITDFNDLMNNHVTIEHDNVVIKAGTDELHFYGIVKADLQAGDFIF
jgi:Ca2+-binding RTX toxin-like protein